MNTVYRHYDKDGKLLYVGRSANPFKRLETHKYQSEWFDQTDRVTLEHHTSFEGASRAEIKAIEQEQPAYNKAHKDMLTKARRARKRDGPKRMEREADTRVYTKEEIAESGRKSLYWCYIHRSLSIKELKSFGRSDSKQWQKENAELCDAAEAFAEQFKDNFLRGLDVLEAYDPELT